MKRLPLIATIIIFLAFVCLGIAAWSWKQDREMNRQASDSILTETIKQKNQVIAIAAARFDSLAAIKASDDSMHAAGQGRLITEIKALKHRDRLTRGADTVFLTTRDTIILVQDTLITDLRAQVIGNDSLCNAMLQAKDTIIEARGIMAHDLGEALKEERKDSKRARRWKRVERTGWIVVVIIAAVL